MLNAIWLCMVLAAVICGAATGKLDLVAKASTDSAGAAVTLAIGLVGVMSFWLGMMRVLEQGGLMKMIARGLRPLMVRLFPDVPAEHPAMSMMILNISANLLGLGNAATPFGLKAMTELDKLNAQKGTVTDAMSLFLAINTSGLVFLPTGVIAVRASLGSHAPGSIFITTLVASACATLSAVVVAKLCARLTIFKSSAHALPQVASDDVSLGTEHEAVEHEQNKTCPTRRQRIAALVALVLVLFALVYAVVDRAYLGMNAAPVGLASALKIAVGDWALVILIVVFVLFGMARGVAVYDAAVEGGKEGFQVALRIIPYLVLILVAVGMLRASGALDALVALLDPVTGLIGLPAEALPMALLRPLSGSGAFAIATETMKVHGPDSLVGRIVSTLQGNDTTFYVLALYCGAIGIRNARYAVIPCLTADIVGVIAAAWACRYFV